MATILLADHEDPVRNLVGVRLEAAGHTVASARDGREALELARSLHPDLILLDLRMPVMDGLQALRRIKEDPELEPIPVILMTPEDRAEDVEAGLCAGAAGHVVKPFSLKELSARVEEQLARVRADEA